jgi:hypothetical protein
MDFEWNNDKQESNLQKHGVDFLDAVRIFSNPVLEWVDTRKDYGEKRIMTIGYDDENYFIVVSTWRGKNRRVISAWKAGTDEKEKYHPYFS